MDWLDLILIASIIFLLLWFFEKIIIWSVFIISKGKVILHNLSFTGISQIELKLKKVSIVVNYIGIRFRKRQFIITIESLVICYHPTLPDTDLDLIQAKEKRGKPTTELKTFYLPSFLYYPMMFVRFEIFNVKFSHSSKFVFVSCQHLGISNIWDVSKKELAVLFCLRSVNVRHLPVSSYIEAPSLLTCFEISFTALFIKENFAFTTRYKLPTVNCDIKEPLLSLQKLQNSLSSPTHKVPASISLGSKLKMSPEMMLAFLQYKFLRRLRSLSVLPPTFVVNIYCFKLDEILPKIESSVCTFSYMQTTFTVLDRENINCKCSVPQFECHFVQKSVSTLLLQALSVIIDIRANSIFAHFSFEELDSQFHFYPDDETLPHLGPIPVSLECSQSLDMKMKVLISSETSGFLEQNTKYSKSEFKDLGLDVRLEVEGKLNDLNVTTYGSSENDPHFCLKHVTFNFNGSNFIFRYEFYIDFAEACSAPFVIETFVHTIKQILPRKKNRSVENIVGKGHQILEHQVQAMSPTGQQGKIKVLNEMISINMFKYVLLSDPDPATGRVHKVVLSVQELLRNAIECVDIKFASLNIDIYHDDRTNKFLEVINFSLKEVTKPWKSAEVKIDSLKSDWDPSSHMTLHSMMKFYARIFPTTKMTAQKVNSAASDVSQKQGKELAAWKFERKLKNVIQTSITCNSLVINAKTLDPSLCKSMEDSITNCFQLKSVDVILDSAGVSLKCHTFNVFCDAQKVLTNEINSNIKEPVTLENDHRNETPKRREDSIKKHPNRVEPIVSFNEFYLRYCCISSAPTIDREKFSLFSKNHCLLLEVNSCKLHFPNKYVFHENFTQFTLARKWLKSLYVRSSTLASAGSSPTGAKSQKDNIPKSRPTFVWPDFNFFLGNFTFSIEDSPFEKRLGENYRLLLDEKLQQIERWELFERRWAQLEIESGSPEVCSAEKRQQMTDQLMKLNSSLYAQRWKESRSIFSPSVSLVLFSIDNFQINCFADEEMTGRENIVNNMNELDGKTTVPEALQFSSQACRLINVGFDMFKIHLRNYPDAMYEIQNCTLNGKLLIVVPRTENSLSFADFSLGPHFESARLKRNPGNQKWFFNLSKNCEKVVFNWSQNRDPVWNEVSHGLNLITKPSTDPSPPLPFWDKARHRTHGNLHCYYKSLEITWLCTLDPYKQSEKLRIMWHNVHFDWIPNNINLGGDLKVVVHTSGKSPLTLMQAPRTRMSWNFTYNCLGNPYGHHLATYSPQNIHSEDYDTYYKFRSLSFDVIFAISIKPTMSVFSPGDAATIINDETLLHRDLPGDSVKIEMYSSTFNWCHRFLKLASTTSRPIRRGKYYKNARSKRKAALSRHFRNFVTKFDIPTLTYSYRVSQKKDLGVTMYFSSDSRLKSEQSLHLENHDRPLIGRSATKWLTRSLIFDLNNVFIYVISDNTEAEEECSLIDSYIKEKSNKQMPHKLHFMSIQSLSYQRTEIPQGTLVRNSSSNVEETGNSEDFIFLTPIHSLSAVGVHATWSRRNRRIIMRLYDQYHFSKSLRQNLSSDALKPIVVVSNERVKPKPDRRMSMAPSTFQQQKRVSLGNSIDDSESSEDATGQPNASSTQGQKVNNPFCDPLYEILVKDIDSKRFFGFNEEKYIEEDEEEDTITLDDVSQLHLKVTISDLQLKLLGFDTPGLVIVTASDAQMNKYQHESLWYEEKLYSKHSLQVSFTDMQYFATLSYNDLVACEENNETVAWLPTSVVNVESINLSKSMEEQSFQEDVFTEAIGALVSSCGSYRLQRIISRCCCSVALLNFRALSETDDVPIYNVPSKKQISKKAPVSLFRLHHNDLCICTNSFQYSLVLDIVNNLILYQEKSRKISNENLKILRLSMQVNEYADLKSSIINLQRNLREGNFMLRQLKREKVVLENKLKAKPNLTVVPNNEIPISASCMTLNWHALSDLLTTQEKKVQLCKEELEAGAQRLKLALTCYKELQLRSKIQLPNSDEMAVAANKKEIVFAKAKWSLTEVDGQIAFSDVCLTNFHYTKIARNDDSMDHKVILEDAEVKNLINNDHFVDILQTHEKDRVNAKSKMSGSSSDVGSVSSNSQDDEVSVDSNRGMILVVQMREKPAVGGIQIREVLDIKIAPLNIHLTEAFWKTMKQFLFPVESKKKQEEEELYQMTLLTTALTADRSSKLTLANNTSSSYSLSAAFANKKKRKAKKESKLHDFEKRYMGNGPDSIDLAFERAAKNCMFVMIRIREVPIHVSYRGDKKKNIEDIHNMHIVLPKVDIHNMTMTWRDLLNNIRSEVTKTIVKGWMQEKLRLGAYRNKLLTDEDQAALMIDKEKLRKLNEQHLSKQK